MSDVALARGLFGCRCLRNAVALVAHDDAPFARGHDWRYGGRTRCLGHGDGCAGAQGLNVEADARCSHGTAAAH